MNRIKALGVINAVLHLAISAASVFLASYVLKEGPVSGFDFFYIDALSAFFILTISVVNLAAALYSIGYMEKDVEAGTIKERKAGAYYGLFNLFAFTMYFVTVVNNLGMLWVAIEMTTLVSAFLVGFYNNKRSIEAAWKYIIICSVGITLALLGTILFYYTASRDGGISSLNWTDMMDAAGKLDPKVLKVAFLFILVGYGTKAGLAPMHTWLPDAHSQAPAPISALLSGVLLKTAIYAIIRFTSIINICIGTSYSDGLLIFFGLLSLGVSAAFVIVQKDIKRLFAYSSVEHIGVITFGLGMGGALGLFGALFHVFNHAVTKSLMFFSAGNVVKKYKTSEMGAIRGVLNAMPFTGIMLIIGAFALTGSPPFSVFFSEVMILISGFGQGLYLQSALFLLFLAIIFGAVIHHISKIAFGKKPQDMPVSGEPLSGKMAFVLLLLFICALGFKLPALFSGLITSAIEIIRGA
ncbi:MAG: hydrogenase 4 subunit F [Candidatus Omnitrophota bacterium]|jgi:hydrogenase-4 component F